jgi:biotin operon repressor
MFKIDLKMWLLVSGYTQAQIARDLAMHRQNVWKTINGKERNRKVLAWLEQHGYSNASSIGIGKNRG